MARLVQRPRCAPFLLALELVAGCGTPHAAAKPVLTPPPTTAAAIREPTDGAACALRWAPRDVGSVLVIPGVIMARPLDRAVEAACRCVHPGEDARILVQIDFHDGAAVATAPDASAIDGCLAQVPLVFEAYRPEGPVTDCIACGPRRYGIFVGSEPLDTSPPDAHLRVTFPLRVDRTGEP